MNAKLDGAFATLREETKAQINGLETRMIRWMAGTAITCAGVAFTFARYVL